MSESPSQQQDNDAAVASAPAPEPAPRTNPNLSAHLRADFEALQNDFQQASELAADFQRQLAGKSNEMAHLKMVFEQTRKHLLDLHADLTELRAERHKLANEAMQVTAYEIRLKNMTAERDRACDELAALREGDGAGADRLLRKVSELEASVARLTIKNETLIRMLDNVRQTQNAHLASRVSEGRVVTQSARPISFEGDNLDAPIAVTFDR